MAKLNKSKSKIDYCKLKSEILSLYRCGKHKAIGRLLMKYPNIGVAWIREEISGKKRKIEVKFPFKKGKR